MSAESDVKKCSNCGNTLKFIGNSPMRIGGGSGAFVALSHGLTAIGESTWPLDFYQCEKCGHVEMFDLNQWPEVLRKDKNSGK